MMIHHHGIYNKQQRTGVPANRDTVLGLSLGMNAILVLSLLYLATILIQEDVQSHGRDIIWHGGHPEEKRPGSCWCGADKHCRCTPSMAIDLVIVSGKQREFVWLVRRKDTDQLATMGGFVDVDESVEHAVQRELKEEMNIHLKEQPQLFGVYSDARRDNRRRTVSAVYAVYVEDDMNPSAGDDAKEVKKILLDEIENHSFFADHRTILLDYRRFARGESHEESTEGDFAPDIRRSVCPHA